MNSVNGHRKRCFRKQLLIPLCPFYSYKEAASLKEALFKVPPSNSQFEHSTIKIFMKIEMEYLLHSNFLHFNLQTNSWILVLGFRIWDLRSEPNSDKNYWFLGNFWKALEKASSKPNPTGFGKIAIRGSNSELPWKFQAEIDPHEERKNKICIVNFLIPNVPSDSEWDSQWAPSDYPSSWSMIIHQSSSSFRADFVRKVRSKMLLSAGESPVETRVRFV